MRLQTERDLLVHVLTAPARAARAGRFEPILGCLRLALNGNALAVVGTDLDLTINCTASVVGAEDGVVAVPGRLLLDVVRSLPSGMVELARGGSDGDRWLRISSGRSEFRIGMFPVEDFPHVPVSAAGLSVQVETKGFTSALEQVLRSASKEDSRPILTGVLISSEEGHLRMVATDSYRLSVRDVPGERPFDTDRSVLVPARALSEVQRLLLNEDTVSVTVDAKYASFGLGALTVISRLIEGEYPNYRPLIPETPANVLSVDRSTLAEALKRVRLMAGDTTPVKVMVGETVRLVVESLDRGRAEEELEADYDGEEMTVAFNPVYLLEGVEAIGSAQIELRMQSALKPATITDGDFLYLVMPVRT